MTFFEKPVRFGADRARYSGAVQRLGDHLDRHGMRPHPPAEVLFDALDGARLTGRGGGHFPAATKWRAALAERQAGARGCVVIANGAEGEPASAKDTALLQLRPHLVLDGLAIAADVLGASRVVVWLHASDRSSGRDQTYRAVIEALDQRRAAGLVEAPVEVLRGPDAYLTGHVMSVVQGVSGERAVPVLERVPAARRGVDGLPTLVHNVETLARIALLARGVHADEVLLTVADPWAGGALTVVQAAPGCTLAEAVAAGLSTDPRTVGAQGVPRAVQAALVGGYGGSWLPWGELAVARIGDLDGRRPVANPTGTTVADVSLGAGVLAPLPQHACGVVETARVIEYLARSSARQCGPCLHGTRALADTWQRLADGTPRRGDLERVLDVAGEIAGRGACALPDGAVQVTRSAVRTFADELDRHIRTAPRRFGPRRPAPCPASGVLPVPHAASVAPPPRVSGEPALSGRR